MSENNKGYERGLAFKEWIDEFFSTKEGANFFYEKYGLTPEELPEYGDYGFEVDDYGFKFIKKRNKPTHVVISGVKIPLKEIPGYLDAWDEPMEVGFWGAVFGLPPDWDPTELVESGEVVIDESPKAEATVATGEIQEEMDAEEAADPAFQELTKEEPVDFASRFYSPEDFQEKGSSQTISTEQVNGNASQWELYLNYIIQGGDTPAEAWAKVTQSDPSKFGQIYKWDADKKIRKPAMHYHITEDGVEHFIPIPIAAQPEQHIVPGTFNDALHKLLTPDQIEHLKDVLIMSGIAKEDDFYNVGTPDSALIGLMENIVEKANTQYGHIKYKSDDYYKLVNNADNLFGSITNNLTDQQKFEWGLVGVVLSQYKGLEKKSAELTAKEKGQQALLDKPLISTQEMAANINRWVRDEIGVDATDEQVKKYTDAWISNHTEYGKQIEYANKVASIGMDVEHYLIESGRTLSLEEVKAMQDDVGAGGDVLTGIVGTRDKIPTVTDASTATFYQIQDDLSAQKDMIEAGRIKRTKQSNILQAMAGKF